MIKKFLKTYVIFIVLIIISIIVTCIYFNQFTKVNGEIEQLENDCLLLEEEYGELISSITNLKSSIAKYKKIDNENKLKTNPLQIEIDVQKEELQVLEKQYLLKENDISILNSVISEQAIKGNQIVIDKRLDYEIIDLIKKLFYSLQTNDFEAFKDKIYIDEYDNMEYVKNKFEEKSSQSYLIREINKSNIYNHFGGGLNIDVIFRDTRRTRVTIHQCDDEWKLQAMSINFSTWRVDD